VSDNEWIPHSGTEQPQAIAANTMVWVLWKNADEDEPTLDKAGKLNWAYVRAYQIAIRKPDY